MTGAPRPPRLAQSLLRRHPLGHRRAEVEADLLELFQTRAGERGVRYARRRYYAEVLSLWRHGGFGGTVVAESSRPSFGGVLHDLSYATRLFRRQPGVVAVTVAGLALAIGVSTAVFSLLNAVALRPSGVAEASSIYRVLRAHGAGTSTSWPYSDVVQFRARPSSMAIEAWLSDGAALGDAPGSDAAEGTGGVFATAGYLQTLGARPSLGRMLAPPDDDPGAPPAIVLGYMFWSQRFGADPHAVGRTVWLNGAPFTVAGVAERSFIGITDATPPAFWAPLGKYHLVFGGEPFGPATRAAVSVIGRLKPGVAPAQAEAQLGAVAVNAGSARVDSSGDAITGVRLLGHGERLSPSERSRMATVAGIVTTVIGLVLLLACVNVANLLFASSASRYREIGVRLALGASRARIIRQLLTESLMLGLAGGTLGLIVAAWLIPVLTVITRAPRYADLGPDVRVYAFLAIVSIVSGVGAGLAPARFGARGGMAAAFDREGTSPALSGRARTFRTRSALIAVQAAASVVLLVLAALLGRAMVRATQIDIGFEAHRLVSVSPAFPRGGDGSVAAAAYWTAALERVRAVPGVQSTSLAAFPPFGDGSMVSILRRQGARYTVHHNLTRADYFEVLGLPVIRGRVYTADEVARAAPVAVISEKLARDFWPGDDPIGRSIERIDGQSKNIVIGVVGNAITARLRELGGAAIYRPLEDHLGARLIVRTAAAPERVLPAVRGTLETLDGRVRIQVSRVSDGLEEQLSEPRVLATLAAALGALALALAIVGIYGMTTFVVGQRTREIGVRVAIGATARDILVMLLRDSLRPVAIGLVIGTAVALAGARMIAAILYGVSPADPFALLGAAALLLVAAAAAVIVPARRAVGVDPALVLRQS